MKMPDFWLKVFIALLIILLMLAQWKKANGFIYDN